jgi:hypothetical protein
MHLSLAERKIQRRGFFASAEVICWADSSVFLSRVFRYLEYAFVNAFIRRELRKMPRNERAPANNETP